MAAVKLLGDVLGFLVKLILISFLAGLLLGYWLSVRAEHAAAPAHRVDWSVGEPGYSWPPDQE